MAFYQKLAAHTVYQIIARIASSGASFLITILIARHFGVASYGDYAKVTAFVTIFYLLADFGLNAIFLQKTDVTQRFKELFYTRLLLSIGLVVVVNFFAFILPYNPITQIGFSPLVRMGISLFSLTIICEAILYSAFAVFQRRMIYERFMWATSIGSVISLVSVGCFILIGLPLVWVFVGLLFGAIVEAGFSILFSEEKLFPVKVHVPFVRVLMKETIPVAFMLLFNLIYFRVDMLLLALFRPSTDVGFYDISYRVFDFLIALPLFLSNVLYPKLINDEKNKRNTISKQLQYSLMFVIFGALVVIPFWFGSPLLFYVVKPSLLPATVPLRILLLSLPVFFVTSILQWLLLSKKQQKFLAAVYFFLTVVNVLLNLLFIPQYGYIASAIITGVCEAGVLLVFLIRLRQL